MCKGVEIVCASRFLFLQVKLMRSSEIYWIPKFGISLLILYSVQFADTVLCSVCWYCAAFSLLVLCCVALDLLILYRVQFAVTLLCSVCWCCAVFGWLILYCVRFADGVLHSVFWYCDMFHLLILSCVQLADTALHLVCWYCTALSLLILYYIWFAYTVLCSVVDGALEGWLQFFGCNIKTYLWHGVLTLMMLKHMYCCKMNILNTARIQLYSLDRRLCGNPRCFWEEKYLFPLPGIKT